VIRAATVASSEALELTATEVSAAVTGGQLDPAALIRACMEDIEGRYDLFAVLARGYGAAIGNARRGVSGPLAGVPVLVSDTIDTAGLMTTFGSWTYRERMPERSATAVALLERAGAIVIGKANVDEFGWGVTGQNPHWGFVANPLRPELISGGVCGGAAAGLAARLCALALGSDADGGLRVPAACCGMVAFKPAPDRVSRRGSLRLTRSFDAVGPMARTVRDCALAYAALTGGPMAEPRIASVRVGALARTPGLERLESLGAVVEEVELPRPHARLTPAFLLECAVSQRGVYPERREEFGGEARIRWDAARAVPAIDAWEAREALCDWRRRAESKPAVDVIVTPTLGGPIPARGAGAAELDRTQDLDGGLTRYTMPFGLLGWPALAIGNLQIAGRDERMVLGVGLAYEEAFGTGSSGARAPIAGGESPFGSPPGADGW
jgi:aspartyl-tRNA(Asn)/glutamyl-tRNA(Gln) amidotransferase subunit A